MQATARLKQLISIAAALAVVALGFVAALSTASPAQATGTGDCVPTQDKLSVWADSGAPFIMHGDATPPADPDGTDEASTTNLVRYVKVSETKHVTKEAVPGTPAVPSKWWNFSPNDQQGPFTGPPAFPTDSRGTWQGPHTEGGPSQELTGTFQQGNGNAPWFHREPGTAAIPGQDEVSHTDYTWQKQTRTFTEGVDCPTPPEECDPDYNGEAEGCGTPPEVCDPDYNGEAEGCGTPPEEKPSICHPVNGKGELGNGWNLIAPADASSHIDESLYPGGHYWQHEAKDGRHDIYAVDGKCPGDQLTEVTPMAEGTADDCDPDMFGTISVTAVEGVTYTLQDGSPVVGTIAANGINTVTAHLAEGYVLADGAVSEWVFESNPAVDCPAPPCEETQTCPDPGPDCETDPHAEGCPPVCPEEADNHPGEVIPDGETADTFCNEDDEEEPNPNCQDDPTLPGCEEDNPPVPNDPGPPNNPSNHPNQPSNGPTVKGAQATSPTAAAPAGTPAAQVPTAIDAGLAPSQEPAGDGGPLGLLGIATALVGATLVGLTVRPRRRIGAASRART